MNKKRLLPALMVLASMIFAFSEVKPMEREEPEDKPTEMSNELADRFKTYFYENLSDRDLRIFLLNALSKSDKDQVADIVRARPDILLKESPGGSLFHWAVVYGTNADILTLLLNTTRPKSLQVLLSTAIKLRKPELVKALLIAGASPTNRLLPLDVADIVRARLLPLDYAFNVFDDILGGDEDNRTKARQSILALTQALLLKPQRPELAKFLRLTRCNQNLLHLAAAENDSSLLTHLVKFLPINLQDRTGNTPLHIAAELNHSDVTRALLSQRGIQVNIRGRSGNTPLHVAVGRHSNDVANALLSRPDIQVNHLDDRGNTPLHIAVAIGNDAIASSLLSRSDIEVNHRNAHGRTPLMIAAYNNNVPIIKALLDRHADLTLVDNEGKTVYNYAEEPEAQMALAASAMQGLSATQISSHKRMSLG